MVWPGFTVYILNIRTFLNLPHYHIFPKICTTILLSVNISKKLLGAGLGGSVGFASDWVRPPPGWQDSFVEIWSWNIFYGHSLPSADSRRAVVSFWRQNVHNTGYPLRELSLVKVWLGKLTAFSMTPLGWLGRKTHTQKKKKKKHTKKKMLDEWHSM